MGYIGSFLRLWAGLMLAVLCAAPATAGDRVTVFAAASLRGALDEVAAGFDGEVVVSYGGSAAQARQVALGAPADIVILANAGWMDWLDGEAALAPGSRVDLLGNRLVVVGAAGAADLGDASALPARLQGGRLAIGLTQGVPAGIYGRAWLEAAGLWPALAGHLAETEDVRAALALVARGEAPLGVVYASDALAEARVSVVYEVPGGLHPDIRYPAALVAGAGLQAAEFMEFLQSPAAMAVFARHGFLPLPGPA